MKRYGLGETHSSLVRNVQLLSDRYLQHQKEEAIERKELQMGILGIVFGRKEKQ